MSLSGRTDQNLFRNTLSADELFSGLTPTHRRGLDSIEKHVRFLPDKTVFASGDQPIYIYVLRRGQAAVYHNGPDSSGFAVPVEPNHAYGIIEALSGKAFNIGMKTITDSDIDVISRDEFLRFVRDQPGLAFKLAEMLSRLYQNVLQQIKSH